MSATATHGYYPSSTCCITASSSDYFNIRIQYREQPDPKKRKPFYRKIVTLNSIPEPVLTIVTPKKRQWNPSMGRVRINRS